MSKIKYLLFLIPFLFITNVFAADQNVTNKIKYSPDTATGTYKGDEIYLGGYNGVFSVNTRYNGRLSYIEFYLSSNDWNWNYNKTYTITLKMATKDWRNHFMGPQVFRATSSGLVVSGSSNMYLSNTFRFVSYYQIKFNFKTPGAMSDYTKFVLYSTDYASNNSVAITGDNNWQLSSVVISDSSSGSSGSSGGGSVSVTPTPSPTPNNTQEIINNANDNAQSIIDSNTSNTTDIIDNNNANTEDIINNQQFNSISELNAQRKSANSSCKNYYDFSISYGKKQLTATGELVDSNFSTYYTEQYVNIAIIPNSYGSTLSIKNPVQSITGYRFAFYDSSYNFISYVNLANRGVSIPSNAQYFRFVSPVSNTYIYRGTNCISSGDETTNAVNNASQNEINNANQNSQNEINNANQNSQNEINNANQNSLDVINNNRNQSATSQCSNAYTYTLLSGKQINDLTGELFDTVLNKSFYTNDFIFIGNDVSRVCINKPDNSLTGYNLVFYDSDKIRVAGGNRVATRCIDVPNGAVYFRFASPTNETTIYKNSGCVNRQQETTDAINNLNDTINDDTQPTIDMDLDLASDTPISDLLLMPIHLIQKVYDSANNTCQPYTIPFDFSGGNNTLTFPCFNLSNYVGNNVSNIIDKLLAAVMAYQIGLMCVTIFNDFTSLRDDFGGMYSPRHHDTSSRVGRGEMEGKY